MRLLVLPLIGLGNTYQDSNFKVWNDFVMATRDRAYYYFAVEEKDLDSFPISPDLATPIPIHEVHDFFLRACHLPDPLVDQFGRRQGKIPIDAVMTSRVGIAHNVQATMGDFRRNDYIPVIAIEPLVRLHQIQCKYVQKQMCYGYANSHTWFLNDAEKKSALSYCREFLSGSEVMDVINNGFVKGLWVDTEDVDKIVDNVDKHKKFSVFWGARMSPDKRPELTVELMEKLYSFGRDVRQVMTTHQEAPRRIDYIKNASSIEELKFGCEREEYLKTCASCHMFLCTSEVEGFPTGFWEQLYAIQVGIFPDKPWVRSNLPKEYPYIYGSMIEAHTMIRWIMEHYEEAHEKVAWIKDWIRDNVKKEKVANEVLDMLEKQLKEQPPHIALLDDINPQEKLGNEFTFDQLLDLVEKESMSYDKDRLAMLGYPSRYEIYRYYRAKGYKDTLEKEIKFLWN